MDWEHLVTQLPALDTVGALVATRLSGSHHGDYPAWRASVDALPDLTVSEIALGNTVSALGAASTSDQHSLREALMGLHPWRKGPYNLFGVHIDCEWRSDHKWQRVAPHVDQLAGATVLDVGSGNGYYGWRMVNAGAKLVLGVDPTVLFCMQHQAVNKYLNDQRNWVVPLRFEELPEHQFDVVFSMGVLYHRRDPLAHVERLFSHTKPGGQLVLESLVVNSAHSLEPSGRYARMGNVHVVPTPNQLSDWLRQAGFVATRVVDITTTTTAEQRSTSWMRFESLAEALDPNDAGLTVEGHPAPVRAVVVGYRPLHGKHQ